ncbi:MAG: tetratricopeptide repeat protein, partial [Bacteroidota bacterium]
SNANYFALLANIKLSRKKFQEALELSNKALELDAENILGLNTRSSALLKLNDKEESFKTIEGALKEDPNNAYTHANYGWGLLEKGDHNKALKHFKESLKNDPNFSYAQAGMMEALKAKYLVYRLFLKYAFWMSNLTARYQWGVILGFYFASRGLNSLAANNAAWEPFITPILTLMAIIAFSTWVITPISNLFLRLNKYGKHLLSRKQMLSSNFVGVSAVIFLLSILAYVIMSDERWIVTAAFGFAMMVPFSTMFAPTKYKYSLLIYTGIMLILGLVAIFEAFATGRLLNQYTTIFFFAFIGFQFVANYLLIREDNR